MSPTSNPRYSLVIPAYNEENRIAGFFDSIRQFEGEAIVICDGDDKTADLVETIAKNRPDLSMRCLRFPKRLGKGGGVKAGLEAARTPFVGYADADGSTTIDEMNRSLRTSLYLRCCDGFPMDSGFFSSDPAGLDAPFGKPRI